MLKSFFSAEMSKHSFFPKEEGLEIGKILHKQNATNANLTCTTSNEEAKARKDRKQPEEVNKCPSVLGKSVSW